MTGKKSRELLAERLNVSPAQVGKISKVANSGTEELKEAVKDGTANIAVAAEIAAMEKEDQKRLIEQHQKENGKAISKKDVEAFKNGKSLESNTYTIYWMIKNL